MAKVKSKLSAKPSPRGASGRRPAASGKPQATAVDHAARWTFLTNHSHVLILLNQDPSIVLREVAAKIGITERAVQRIIADLEEAGYIEREKVGRKNQYRIHGNLLLRHPIEQHRAVGSLLSLICDS